MAMETYVPLDIALLHVIIAYTHNIWTHMHAHTRMHMHAHTRMHMHTHTTNVCTCTLQHTHDMPCTQHTCTHTHTHTHRWWHHSLNVLQRESWNQVCLSRNQGKTPPFSASQRILWTMQALAVMNACLLSSPLWRPSLRCSLALNTCFTKQLSFCLTVFVAFLFSHCLCIAGGSIYCEAA